MSEFFKKKIIKPGGQGCWNDVENEDNRQRCQKARDTDYRCGHRGITASSEDGSSECGEGPVALSSYRNVSRKSKQTKNKGRKDLYFISLN